MVAEKIAMLNSISMITYCNTKFAVYGQPWRNLLQAYDYVYLNSYYLYKFLRPTKTMCTHLIKTFIVSRIFKFDVLLLSYNLSEIYQTGLFSDFYVNMFHFLKKGNVLH